MTNWANARDVPAAGAFGVDNRVGYLIRFLETIYQMFQNADRARGTFTYRGSPVGPGAIRETALLTVEDGRDEIRALGQTAAAHDLCVSLRPHHLQAHVGHYGVFSGKRWANQIYPVVRDGILAME